MSTVTIDTAQTTLQDLLARVEAGEEVVLARDDKPFAKLVPLQPSTVNRRFGAFKGQFKVPPEFFDPLPEEELAAWE